MCIRDRKDSLVIAIIDKMAEWLRRWTVNPLGSASVGSNPIFVAFLFGSMVNRFLKNQESTIIDHGEHRTNIPDVG